MSKKPSWIYSAPEKRISPMTDRGDWINALIEELEDIIDRLRGGESPSDGIAGRLFRLGRMLLRRT